MALNLTSLTVCAGLLTSMAVCAEPRLLILEFEVNDLTLLPNTPAETLRTASLKPLLEQAMSGIGSYKVVTLTPAEHALANPNLGALFDHDDTAAELARTHRADWVLVNRHSKPSFLFSYLMSHVIEARSGRVLARLNVEMKGSQQIVAERGIKALATKVHQVIGGKPQDGY